MNNRDIEADNDNTIAVFWYDGNQRCKVFNVLPMQCAQKPVDRYLHGATKDNANISSAEDNDNDSNSGSNSYSRCSNNNYNVRNNSESNATSNNNNNNSNNNSSNIINIAIRIDNAGYHQSNEDGSGCSGENDRSLTRTCDDDPGHKELSTKTCTYGEPSSSTDGALTNLALGDNELNKGIGHTHNEPAACSCPGATIEVFHDSRLELKESRASKVSEERVSSSTNSSDVVEITNDMHDVLQQNSPQRTSSDAVVVCNVCHNELSLTTKPASVEEEEPPPQYSSLRYLFLADEPPKYQDVTGKALTSATVPVRHRLLSEPVKRRIVIGCVVVFFLLIGALLVYACFVSGHPLGSYGSAQRKV